MSKEWLCTWPLPTLQLLELSLEFILPYNIMHLSLVVEPISHCHAPARWNIKNTKNFVSIANTLSALFFLRLKGYDGCFLSSYMISDSEKFRPKLLDDKTHFQLRIAHYFSYAIFFRFPLLCFLAPKQILRISRSLKDPISNFAQPGFRAILSGEHP